MRQNVGGVGKPQLVQYVVELVAGQGADGLAGVGGGQQGVGAAHAPAPAEIRTEP